MNKIPAINLSVSLMPTSALPVDARTLFDDMEDLKEAAMSAVEPGSSDSPYYFGQILTYKTPDSTEAYSYKIVRKPQYSNIMSVASLTPQQLDEVVEKVFEHPEAVKIGNDIKELQELVKDPKSTTGLAYDAENGLCVNLAPRSGLNITEDGLKVELSDDGNVSLEKTDNGIKAEYCWSDYEET